MDRTFPLFLKNIWESIKTGFVNLIDPFISFLIRMEINPNSLTTMGFGVSIFAGYFFAIGALRIGAGLVLLSGIFDIMDGRIARGTNQVTRFGALYDSTLDRYAEIIIFIGLAYYFIGENKFLTSLISIIVLAGSLMVSYVRARAEGLGFSCKVGIMQRPERIVTLGISALIHEYVLIAGLFVLAVMTHYTAIQRIRYIWIQQNGEKNEIVTEFDKRD
ncbi:MAG TPA: CDP-alcohol phosphatidyltransferase family protein [Bacteroidetes bacterium]|nr:CDP-alcohol phosphatidyltransferase family protein [Bacteroidota bacterium]